MKDVNGVVYVRKFRFRFWLESILGLTCLVLVFVTLLNAEWIEWLFGVDPDGGSGALEWATVGALAVGAIVAGGFARHEARRALPIVNPAT